VLNANRVGLFEAIVIRPPMIWGDGMPMLESILENIEAGQFRLVNNGSAVMSTVHVDNVCHAVELAIEKGKGGEAYFVSDGVNHSFQEILAAFLGSHNVELPKSSIPLGMAWFMASMMEAVWKIFSRKGEPPITRQLLRFIGKDFTLNISKAERELGYVPTVSWSAGVEDMRTKYIQSVKTKPSADVA
jgi:nucleoside-diphosphate-sugar epimerase